MRVEASRPTLEENTGDRGDKGDKGDKGNKGDTGYKGNRGGRGGPEMAASLAHYLQWLDGALQSFHVRVQETLGVGCAYGKTVYKKVCPCLSPYTLPPSLTLTYTN